MQTDDPPMDELRARAEPLVRAPVELGDLALVFEETTAATVDVHVEGRNFFPLILDDIRAATSSVHINQYGFRPGTIGEEFAGVLLAKAAEGVAVRRRRRPRRLAPRQVGRLLRAAAGRRGRRPGRARGGTHRPPQAVRRRRPRRLGRWRGDRGPLRRRPLPRPVRARDRAGRLAAPARVRRQLPLARRQRVAGAAAGALPGHRAGHGARDGPAQRARSLPPDLDGHRRAARRCARDARRGQPVRRRQGDDPAHHRRCTPRRARPPLRARARQQPRLRGRPALPPRRPARRGRAHPRIPDDAAREGVRPRPRGGAGRHLQPRGVEPEAVLRDRPARALERLRRALRRALLGAGGGDLHPGHRRRRGSGRGSRPRRSRRSRPCCDGPPAGARARHPHADVLAAAAVRAPRGEPVPEGGGLRPRGRACLERAHGDDPAGDRDELDRDPARREGDVRPHHRPLRPDGRRRRGGQGHLLAAHGVEHEHRLDRVLPAARRGPQLHPCGPAAVRADLGAQAAEHAQQRQRAPLDRRADSVPRRSAGSCAACWGGATSM